MTLPDHALVLGLGRTGRSVARTLAGRGVRVRAADARADLRVDDLPGVEVHLGEDGSALLAGVDLVVPSPGVPRDAKVLADAVRRGVPVVSEIELAHRLLDCPVVAITGTNGKSTTTTLVGLALARAGRRVFVGGNLGTPLLDAVGTGSEIAVAEVSSFQLEWVEEFRPRVGCLLNVTPDHLDRHGTFAEYRAAKARLFARQERTDFAVLNRDDPATWSLADDLRARVVSFGGEPVPSGAFVADGGVILRLPEGGEERYRLDRTRLIGGQNVENILAAVAVARFAGANPEAIQAAIDEMEPLPHRRRLVRERQGVRWFDDSKATNVGAAAKSVESCEGPVILLAGGVDKGGGYDALVGAARGRLRLALVFGAAREQIASALDSAGIPVERVRSLEAAVSAAADVSRAGDTVLLAPACASFDMFADYADRGRAFRTAVEALP